MAAEVTEPGLPRSYFYNRIATGLRELQLNLEAGVATTQLFAWGSPAPIAQHITETRRPAMKVTLQDALNRLKVCPVCGGELETLAEYPQERSCDCGDFTITEVYSDGDVVFEFKMLAPDQASPIAELAERLDRT
jgi:hypothetical protein